MSNNIDWTSSDTRQVLEVSFASRTNITKKALICAHGMQRLVDAAERDLAQNPVLGSATVLRDEQEKICASLQPSSESVVPSTFTSTTVAREMKLLVDQAQSIVNFSDALLAKVMDSSGRYARSNALNVDIDGIRSQALRSFDVHEVVVKHIDEHVFGLQLVSHGSSTEVDATQTIVNELEEECAQLAKLCSRVQVEYDLAIRKVQWLQRCGHVRSLALARDPRMLIDETISRWATTRLREIIMKTSEMIKQKSNVLTVVQDRQQLQVAEQLAGDLTNFQLAAKSCH